MTNDCHIVPVAVVLVAYYQHEVDHAMQLVTDFCDAAGLVCRHAVIVDNGNAMGGQMPADPRCQLTPGDNSSWEFSGWTTGLATAGDWKQVPVTVLLNDSYGRNWSISALSRGWIRRMYSTAITGRVAAWQDNFSILKPPRFSRRPNSRFTLLPTVMAGDVALSIRAAIARLSMHLQQGVALFSSEEQARLDEWMLSQAGRWSSSSLLDRNRRIFLEHHMLDMLPLQRLRLFPRWWISSIGYAALRRILRERR